MKTEQIRTEGYIPTDINPHMHTTQCTQTCICAHTWTPIIQSIDVPIYIYI